MQRETIIIISPHSYGYDSLEMKVFSDFLQTTRKHEASSTNQISQVRGKEKGECIKAKGAAWMVGMVEAARSSISTSRDTRTARTHLSLV